jgi:hypothetical protein
MKMPAENTTLKLTLDEALLIRSLVLSAKESHAAMITAKISMGDKPTTEMQNNYGTIERLLRKL